MDDGSAGLRSNHFGNALDEVPVGKAHADRNISSVFNEGPDFVKPSSRVLAPPGGISNIFSNEQEFRPSSRVLSRPGGNTSNIFGQEEVAAVASNRRDPNQSSLSMELSEHHGKKQFAGHNSSSFNLGNSDEGYVAPHTARHYSTLTNASTESEEMPFKHVQRRDPNARSQEIPMYFAIYLRDVEQGRRRFAGRATESHFDQYSIFNN
jgi:hypothetical protein